MAHRVASELAHRPDARLDADVSAAEQDFVIADVIESAVQAGQASVARGPDLLPALRSAGVVDAGGYGLTVMLGGIVAALRGSIPSRPRPRQTGRPRQTPVICRSPTATARTSR